MSGIDPASINNMVPWHSGFHPQSCYNIIIASRKSETTTTRQLTKMPSCPHCSFFAQTSTGLALHMGACDELYKKERLQRIQDRQSLESRRVLPSAAADASCSSLAVGKSGCDDDTQFYPMDSPPPANEEGGSPSSDSSIEIRANYEKGILASTLYDDEDSHDEFPAAEESENDDLGDVERIPPPVRNIAFDPFAVDHSSPSVPHQEMASGPDGSSDRHQLAVSLPSCFPGGSQAFACLGNVISYPVDSALKEANKANILTDQEKGHLKLVAFCDRHNCSRGFTNELNVLLGEILAEHGYDPRKASSRDTLSKKIMHHFTYPGRQPINEWIRLPDFRDRSRCLLIPDEAPTQESSPSPVAIPRHIDSWFRDRVLLVRWNIQKAVEHLHNDVSIFGDLDNLVVNPGDERWLPYRWKLIESGKPRPLDEVLDGRCYHSTIEGLGIISKIRKDDPIVEFVSPLMLYLDKTGTDLHQRYSLEPWVITSCVIRRFLRYHPWAWRVIGFLPDLEGKSKASKQQKEKGLSCANYHFCVNSIIQGLEEISNDGFVTWMRLGDQLKKVRLICPLFLILNDGKSADALVCRYGSHTKQMASLSNRCATNFEMARDPCHVCDFYSRDQVVEALSKGSSLDAEKRQSAHEKLQKEWSIHKVFNAFLFHPQSNVDGRAPEKKNIGFGKTDFPLFRTVASDLMHVNDHGIIRYTVRLVVDPLPPLAKHKLDLLVDEILVPHRSSLKSTYPRTNFSNGFTNLTLITASEWVGCAYVLLLVLSTDRGRSIMESRFEREDLMVTDFNKRLGEIDKLVYARKVSEQAEIFEQSARSAADSSRPGASDPDIPPDLSSLQGGNRKGRTTQSKRKRKSSSGSSPLPSANQKPPPNKTNKRTANDEEYEEVHRKCSVDDLVMVLEALLCYYGFYKREEAVVGWCDELKDQVDSSVRKLLAMIRYYLPRKTGNGWSLQKFHANTHVAGDMDWFGLTQNFNCGQGESGLKFWAKAASQTAQQRGQDKFHKQTGDRTSEFETHSDVLNMLGHKRDIPKPPEKRQPQLRVMDPVVKVRGSSLRIFANWKKFIPPIWSGNEKTRKSDLHVPPSLLEFFIRSRDDNESEEALKACLVRGRHRIDGMETEVEFWNLSTECDMYLPGYRGGRRHIFRAHPNYQNEGPWYDWAMIEFPGENEPFPGKILAFMVGKSPENDAAGCAIVHTCSEELKDLESVLVKHWKLEYDKSAVKPGKDLGSKEYVAWHRDYNQGALLSGRVGSTVRLQDERAVLRAVPLSAIVSPVEVYQECKVPSAAPGRTGEVFRSANAREAAMKRRREETDVQSTIKNRPEDQLETDSGEFWDRILVVKDFPLWGGEFTNLEGWFETTDD